MNDNFLIITQLQYEIRALRAELEAFRSGEKYRKMLEVRAQDLRDYNRQIHALKVEAEEAHRQTTRVRDLWMETAENIDRESKKTIRLLENTIHQLTNALYRSQHRTDEALDRITALQKELKEKEGLLEEERERNRKLQAQLSRDHENSSIPSSKDRVPKPVCNSREKTGRHPGGQPGHKWHGRKRQAPTAPTVHLAPPALVKEDPGFRKTGRTIIKQMVGIRLMLDVAEYTADVYYNPVTGERIHAAFPDGVVDDVNYDGSIRAFLDLLNNECCVSVDRCRRFLSELTGGKLNISKGMISKLARTFSERSREELKKVFADMLVSPVVHIDCTNARYDQKNANVYVCATPDGKALYFAREHKGHEGVKGTVAEDYQGILVHDHDKTFFSYGGRHQECIAHVLRYLKDSMLNEPDLTWNRDMHSLLREMLHYRNSQEDNAPVDEEKVAAFEKRYDDVLATARKEYKDGQPSKYYKDGMNLAARLAEYKDEHLLFLHDHRVPATNNEAERLLRNYKRKQTQATTFRAFDSIEYLCNGMSMLCLLRSESEENVYSKVSEMFG